MSSPESTGLEALERDLQTALRWEPSAAAVHRMDIRVALLKVAAARAVPREVAGWRWPRRRLLVLAIAGLLLMGAASALTLLQKAVDLDPRWRAAYEQAERLNLSQTIGDYTVTLERAYADPNELVLAISLKGPSDSFVALPQARVTDASGRQYLEVVTAGSGDSASGGSGSIHAFQVPPDVATPLDLTVAIEPLKSEPLYDLSSPPSWFSAPPREEPGLVGPWLFHISVPLHIAATVTPAQTVEASGIEITLTSVRITGTSIRVRLDTGLSAVRNEEFSKWSLEGTIRHGTRGVAQALDWIPISPDWTGQPIGPEVLSMLESGEDGSVMMRQTLAGSDAPSGSWTLTIMRLIGSSSCVSGSPWLPCEDPGRATQVDGPWIFRFDVP